MHDRVKAPISAVFRFRDLDEVSPLAQQLAELAAEPVNVNLGLVELMVNAIEHGLLGISGEEKRALARAATMHDEVRRRLADPAYAGRDIEISVSLRDGQLCFVITDPGTGFDWAPDAGNSSHAVPDDAPSGRGIAIASRIGFSRIEYRGCGNVVAAWAQPSARVLASNSLSQHHE